MCSKPELGMGSGWTSFHGSCGTWRWTTSVLFSAFLGSSPLQLQVCIRLHIYIYQLLSHTVMGQSIIPSKLNGDSYSTIFHLSILRRPLGIVGWFCRHLVVLMNFSYGLGDEMDELVVGKYARTRSYFLGQWTGSIYRYEISSSQNMVLGSPDCLKLRSFWLSVFCLPSSDEVRTSQNFSVKRSLQEFEFDLIGAGSSVCIDLVDGLAILARTV